MSFQNFDPNPGQTDFTFSFPYLSKTDLTVSIDGTPTSDWTLLNPSTFQYSGPALTGDEVVNISRNTPISEAAATFASPGTLRASEMNVAINQLLYSLQEQDADTRQSFLKNESNTSWDGEGLPIKNVVAGTESTDVATRGDIDAAIVASGNMPGFSASDAGRVLSITDGAASVWASPGGGISTFGVVADPAPVIYADGGYHIDSGAAGSTTEAGLSGVLSWTTIPPVADQSFGTWFNATAPAVSGDYIRLTTPGTYEIEARFQVRSIPNGTSNQTVCSWALCNDLGTQVWDSQVNMKMGQNLQLSQSVVLRAFVTTTGTTDVALKGVKENDNHVVLERPAKITVRQVR